MNVVDFDPVTLMFQAGYLTIRRKPPVANYCDEFTLILPNLEVKASLFPLLLSLEESFEKPLLLNQCVRAILGSLTSRDGAGVLESFQTFLANVPEMLHIPYEAYYQTIFILVLAMANQAYESEGQAGDGRFDVHFKADNGDDFVIELKHIPLDELLAPITTPTKDVEAVEAALAEKKAALKVIEAMDQIEKKKYAKKFQGGGGNIWKTAMIFGKQTLLKIEFQKADNWAMIKMANGSIKVKPARKKPTPEP
jgi:hypothetical protein